MKPQWGSQFWLQPPFRRLPNASPLSAKPAKSRLQPELAAPPADVGPALAGETACPTWLQPLDSGGGAGGFACLPASTLFVVSLFVFAHSLQGQNLLRPPTNPPSSVRPAELRNVGIDQKLNGHLPLDLHFRDETGRDIRLGDLFGARPVIITPVYYGCPMLCTQILNGLVSGLKPVSFDAGRQFDVLAVSFDPSETPELALKKKDAYVQRYGRAGSANGFHFLTGDEAAIKTLTNALGFRYRYDPKTKQFAHASGLMIATPDGRISRYLYGVDYAPRDLRLALVEASEGKIGSPVDELLLFCYHYDPATGKYGSIAINFLRLAAAATVLGIATLLTLLLRREFRTS